MGFESRVKWPNDLLLSTDGRQRKVAGILTEASSEGSRIGHVVIGIGVNVNTSTFPDDLADKATSLRLACGAPLRRARVLARVLSAIESAYEAFEIGGPRAACDLWMAHADLGARYHANVDHGRGVSGIAAGVAPDGALLIRDDAGAVHRIVAGEVMAEGQNGRGQELGGERPPR